MTDPPEQRRLDQLASELSHVREAGRSPLDVEAVLDRLPQLRTLPVVAQRTKVNTTLAAAEAVVDVVWQAVERLGSSAEERLAQMLFSVDPRTQDLAPAEARQQTQGASGVEMRQFRAKREDRLLRLVAQELLDLQQDEDRLAGARRMMVGADVPQTVGRYWLDLFRDHYFRMETYAYALQTDTMTALQQRRDDLPTWRQYLALTTWWDVQFSYFRDRFFRQHGPLWFSPTEVGGTALSEGAEYIEYHDAFPEEYMSRLRLLYSRLEVPEYDLFRQALGEAGQDQFVAEKAQQWLGLCHCADLSQPDKRCSVHIVIASCERFGETVEQEFALIQGSDLQKSARRISPGSQGSDPIWRRRSSWRDARMSEILLE